MSDLKIPCVSLPGRIVHSIVIPAAELANYFSATSVLALAREEAKTIQQQASTSLALAQEEAQQIRVQAHHQGVADAANELVSLRKALIEETLDWHVAESELEATIAQHLETQLRALVALVLEEFIGEQDALELIVRRVQQRLIPFLAEGNITLYVSANNECQAKDTFASYPQVQVISTPSLATTQALVETALFTLRIDLDGHLQSLLSRLRQT